MASSGLQRSAEAQHAEDITHPQGAASSQASQPLIGTKYPVDVTDHQEEALRDLAPERISDEPLTPITPEKAATMPPRPVPPLDLNDISETRDAGNVLGHPPLDPVHSPRPPAGDAAVAAYKTSYKDQIPKKRPGKAFSDEEFLGKPDPKSTSGALLPDPKWAILSIDGGGVKGVIPATILVQLEYVLREEAVAWVKAARGQPGADPLKVAFLIKAGPKVIEELATELAPEKLPLKDFFNLMAGTSTGSLIVAMLAHPKPDPEQTAAILDFYIQEAESIFGSRAGPKCCAALHRLCRYGGYEEESLVQLLKKHIDYYPSETVVPCVIPTFDLSRNHPVLLATKDSSKSLFHKDVKMDHICRASAAAPTYFRPAKLTSAASATGIYLDGGLYANNPVQHALHWAETNTDMTIEEGFLKPVLAKDTLILSLGTGVSRQPPKYGKNWLDRQLLHPDDPLNWGVAGWGQPSISAAMNGSAKAAHKAMAMLFAAEELMPAYIRLQPRLEDGALMTMDRHTNVKCLIAMTNQYLQAGTLRDLAESPPAHTHEVLQLYEQVRRSYRAEGSTVLDSLEAQREALDETHAHRLIVFAQLLAKNWVVRKAAKARFTGETRDLMMKRQWEDCLVSLASDNRELAALKFLWAAEHGPGSSRDKKYESIYPEVLTVARDKLEVLDFSRAEDMNKSKRVLNINFKLVLGNLRILNLSGVTLTALDSASASTASPGNEDEKILGWLTPDCLPKLESFTLAPCTLSISELNTISPLTTLTELDISGCSGLTSLVDLPFLAEFKKLETLRLSGCTDLQDLGALPTLLVLDVSGCSKVESLPKGLTRLQKLLAAGSGLHVYDTKEYKDLRVFTAQYRLPPQKQLSRKIYGFLSPKLEWVGIKLRNQMWTGRGVLPRPSGYNGRIEYVQLCRRKKMPRTQETEVEILKLALPADIKCVHSVLVRCLFEDNSEYTHSFQSPVTLKVYIKGQPEGYVTSRVHKLGMQLHLRMFDGVSVWALKRGDVIELRAKYLSPAEMVIIHAEIMVFVDSTKPPHILNCLAHDSVIPARRSPRSSQFGKTLSLVRERLESFTGSAASPPVPPL